MKEKVLIKTKSGAINVIEYLKYYYSPDEQVYVFRGKRNKLLLIVNQSELEFIIFGAENVRKFQEEFWTNL